MDKFTKLLMKICMPLVPEDELEKLLEELSIEAMQELEEEIDTAFDEAVEAEMDILITEAVEEAMKKKSASND